MTISKSLEIAGETEMRARGSLSLSGPRELLAKRAVAAAFNNDRSIAPETRVWPNRLPELVPERLPKDDPVVEVCDEEVLWGGCVQPHYGHFLTESVSRLWPLLPGGELEDIPVACVRPARLSYEREWTDAFGARMVVAPKGGLIRFKKALVPEPSCLLHAWIAPEIRDIHLHARRNLDVPTLPRQGILWLSRSGLQREQRAYDEVLLEWILRDHVTIIHPEIETLAMQIAAIEASDGVAGLIGSAFHTLLAAIDPPGCLLLCRGVVPTGYVAQDLLLHTNGIFVQALAHAELHRRRRGKSLGDCRVVIPEALRALGRTLLPALRDDPRAAALAQPECLLPKASGGRRTDDLDATVASVLLDPYSAEARLRLATAFEARALNRCALEQFLFVAELGGDDYAPALDGIARMAGQTEHDAGSR